MLFRRNLLRNCDILMCFCMQSSLKILSGPNTHEAELNFYMEALIMRSATISKRCQQRLRRALKTQRLGVDQGNEGPGGFRGTMGDLEGGSYCPQMVLP